MPNDTPIPSSAPELVIAPAPEAPVVVPEAVATPTPEVATAPAVTEKPFEHTDVKSLLAIEPEAAKTPEVTEAPAAPAATPAPTVEPAVTAAPAVVEYKFTPPEGLSVPEAALAPYVDVLKANNISPEVGQKLFDLHAAAVQELGAQTLAAQHQAFADVRKTWQTQLLSDPELGGSGFETVKGAVARMRDLFVSPAYQQEFNDFLNTTGAGEHPALWRLLWNAAKAFDEPRATPAGGAPPPNHGKPPGRKGMKNLYNNSN